jgi:transcriptional regulator with XRE-family HTH domain
MYPNVKYQIFKLGLRQNSLAKALGMGDAALSKIINGYREANPAERKLLAEILQADEAWLFEKHEAAAASAISLAHAASKQAE